MITLRSLRSIRALLAVLALSLLAAACNGNGDDNGAAEGTAEGGTVNIMGALVGDDEQNLLASIQPWAEENGITIQYEGSGDFETLVVTRVDGGNPPDVALFPQPGLMAELSDDLRDLSEVVDTAELEDSFVPGLIDIGTVDDRFVGLMYRLNLKSLVWYPRQAWEEAGYEEPATWDDMIALTEQIASEQGVTPWCIGIESAGATGWVVTDWMEDIMLRTAGEDAYDQWVAGELEFTSEEVTRAAELFAEIGLNEEWVLGGRQGIVTTPFGDSPDPMFEDPPACWLHRQAQFIEAFFPDDVQENVVDEADFFAFPEIDADQGTPALIAGDLVALFTDNPAAEALVEYMSTPESGEVWAGAGAFLSPHTGFDQGNYPNELAVRQDEILNEASFARFDASDMMPARVGQGTFWTEMTAWIAGERELEQALQNIDDSWPAPGEDAEADPDDVGADEEAADDADAEGDG
jgi:alpha-glucoside transport system substrate-binding protein